MIYIIAILSTLAAWFAGLLLDANIDFNPQGFLCFRMLLPVLAMGICILHGIKQSKGQQNK